MPFACRVCGSTDLTRYLDLGTQAPANALRKPSDLSPEFAAPLSVAWCAVCGLSQLEQVIDPAILYTNYPFRAGTSHLWRQHCEALAAAVTYQSDNPQTGFWLDIGANDGVLLQAAQARGWRVLGVDPGGVDVPVPMLEECWTSQSAKGLTRFHGKPHIITATNVFGHVNDPLDFLQGCAEALHPLGRIIIECPHIIPLLDAVAFDTIYHEHLSYWSLKPLEILAERVGLAVTHCQWFHNLHGGTMRYTLAPKHVKPGSPVTGLRILENGLFLQGLEPYTRFAEKAKQQIDAFRHAVKAERTRGNIVAGYGASAKGSVRIQAAGLNVADIALIVDDSPAKWGFLSPGTDIPICGAGALGEVNVLILLSWNNAKDLKAKARKAGFTGRFLTPASGDVLVEAA